MVALGLKSYRRNENFIHLTFINLFWLFIVGSLIGVVLEGIFCVFYYGHWETHVVSIWGPFCILYGIGAVGCYAGHCYLKDYPLWYQFIAYFVIFSAIEFVCGFLLEVALNMRAWTYINKQFNVRGHICLTASLAWGFLGIGFSTFLAPPLERLFARIKQPKPFVIITYCCTAFMTINFLLTGVCIARWSARHRQIPPHNKIERYIDNKYDDEYMKKRFCEWRFIS